ncbi:MAG: NosD domain-containing protein [Actinomycetaceae bacterium]|nr:NosD domain-containing protein [Actinomycetaceae bacterium]
MQNNNYYDVTKWDVGNPLEDIGAVINSIIDDIKKRQNRSDVDSGGKPGAVIYIPPGDYSLRTQVNIDVSFLRIVGSGHGFTSSSIRFNTPEESWPSLHELWPGGSRVKVELETSERNVAAFLVKRDGSPRLSSIEFSNFCIDGLHFVENGPDEFAENTYLNSKIGIEIASANDSVRISGMGFIYLEQALLIYNADALSIHDNFIAECGSCIELVGWGQASTITNNLIGAGFRGHSIYAENHGGLLISANNVFPRGASSIHLRNVTRSNISSNRLHSFYPGMLRLEGACSENLISSNHLLRDGEPWTPFAGIDNGLENDFGVVRIEGDDNTFTANHVSVVLQLADTDLETTPVILRLARGTGNYVASNHMLAKAIMSSPDDSCFEAQVDALQSVSGSELQQVTVVQVDSESSRNVILDSCSEAEAVVEFSENVFRGIPGIKAD